MATTTPATLDLINLIQNLATLNLGYLGVSVTILIVFGGAFYLFNFKPLKDTIERQERTLTDLKTEVEKNLSSSKEEIKEDLKAFQIAQTETISKSVDQKNENLFSDFNSKISDFERDFSEKFSTFAVEKDDALKTVVLAEVSNQIRTLEKTLTATIDKNKTDSTKSLEEIKSSISSLRNELKDLKRKVGELEVFKFSQKGQMGAIYGSVELLKQDIDDNSWRIDGSLEDLNKELKGIELEGEVITRIEEQLVRLADKPKYQPLVEKVRKNYPAI